MSTTEYLWAQWGVLGSIVAILVLTVLELPPPIGFETRAQSDVSPLWLALFATILISEIAAMLLIFRRPIWGARLAVIAGCLNIVQILADQLHLMQPEAAPAGYAVLELVVGAFSISVIYFACRVLRVAPAE